MQVEAGKYPFPTVVGEGGTGGEWFESVRRALRWNNRGAVQKGFGSVARGWDGNAEGDEEIEETEREVLDEEWDIDADPIEVGVLDSGFGASEESGSSAG